jgi:hypothetical protein
MCPRCQEIGTINTPLLNFINKIQSHINYKIKKENKDDIVLKVICSGISHIRGQYRPEYNNSYTPIDINNNQVLYMAQNPIYTYSLDSNVDSKQYLTMMKNYLSYTGNSW